MEAVKLPDMLDMDMSREVEVHAVIRHQFPEGHGIAEGVPEREPSIVPHQILMAEGEHGLALLLCLGEHLVQPGQGFIVHPAAVGIGVAVNGDDPEILCRLPDIARRRGVPQQTVLPAIGSVDLPELLGCDRFDVPSSFP